LDQVARSQLLLGLSYEPRRMAREGGMREGQRPTNGGRERVGGGSQAALMGESRRWPGGAHGRKRQGRERCALLLGFDVGTRVSS
jgi:hypothetical protein